MLKEIKNFEVNNGILVNVLGLEGKDIYLCHFCGEFSKEVNLLLLISEGEKWHYASIKSLSRLLGRGNSKNTRKKHFCKNCLQGFMEESSREKHYSYCIDNELVRVEMPTKLKSILKFRDGQGQLDQSAIHDLCRF